MEMQVEQGTNVGLEREENQDDLGWFSPNKGELFIVADGMGGEAGGKAAAKMAISTIKEVFETGEGSVRDLLKTSTEAANCRIHELGNSGEPRYHKMGSTVVVLFIRENKAYIAHDGDSRIYLYRGNQLHRMTKDHSHIQQMIDGGLISPEDAEDHPDANIITRSLGAKPTIEVDIRPEPLTIYPGDLFLLCTDGLCGLANDHDIQNVLAQGRTAKETCDDLINVALNKGGYDNVTVQVVSFEREPGEEIAPPSSPLKTTGIIGWARYKLGLPILLAAVCVCLGLFTGAAWLLFKESPPPKKSSEITQTTIVSPRPQPPTMVDGDASQSVKKILTVEVNSGANVREKPSMDAKVSFTLKKGDTVRKTGPDRWYLVMTEEKKTGWARKEFFEDSREGGSFIVRESDSVYEKPSEGKPQKLFLLNKGGRVSVIHKDDIWFLIMDKKERTGWAHRSLFEEHEEFTIVKPDPIVPLVKVYQKPSDKSEELFNLKEGDEVSVIHTEDDWHLIMTKDKKTGWAFQSLFVFVQKNEESLSPQDETDKKLPHKKPNPATGNKNGKVGCPIMVYTQ